MTTKTANAIDVACGDAGREEVYALLEHLARERVKNDAVLSADTEIIFHDWSNWSEHIPWLLTATTEKIADWIETVRTPIE